MGTFRRFAEWIPAFAGMTTAWSVDTLQMMALPKREHKFLLVKALCYNIRHAAFHG
jgi:hypothetical protein